MPIGLSQLWTKFQPSLFPSHTHIASETTKSHQRLIYILDNLGPSIQKELEHLPESSRGRNKIDRFCFFAAFIAQKVMRLDSVISLIDRLQVDPSLRRICRFNSRKVPCPATFSNVFREFADTKLAEKLHEQLIKDNLGEDLIHNISRDATSIPARETPIKKAKIETVADTATDTSTATATAAEPKKRGRPKKGEEKPKVPTRIELQANMTLEEMVEDLPIACDYGGKKDSQGNFHRWKGYKLHIDTSDGDIPISAIITSASVHDSQVAIPLEEMTSQRVNSMYTLSDAAYNSKEINKFIESKGKVSIADTKKSKNQKKIPLEPMEARRYKARSSAERTNSNLKDNLGVRSMRVRGASKVMSFVSFGLLTIATEQIMKLNFI